MNILLVSSEVPAVFIGEVRNGHCFQFGQESQESDGKWRFSAVLRLFVHRCDLSFSPFLLCVPLFLLLGGIPTPHETGLNLSKLSF